MTDSIPSASGPAPYAILRIKRKRTDEPLEALVIESSKRRKSRGVGGGVFQFAETLEENAWAGKQQEIQKRICSLASTANDDSPRTSPLLPSTSRSSNIPTPRTSRRYTVLQTTPVVSPEPQHGTKLPQIGTPELSTIPSSSGFTVYDAVPAPSPPPVLDEEMEKFKDLLQEYLKVHDEEIVSPHETGATATSEKADDYVWDIFYHSTTNNPAWTTGNVATLVGLPQSFGEGYSSGSDSDFEDEEDEDSNAEDFYRNDYPDEEDHPSSDESSGSDIFHEDSEREYNDNEVFDPNEWR